MKYYYKGKVVRVVDGDTLDVELDLGLKIYAHERVRLLGVDTPEIYGRASDAERQHGREAKDYVESLVLGKEVFVQTVKDRTGKYGRYLAYIFFTSGDADINLSEAIIEAGFKKRGSYE